MPTDSKKLVPKLRFPEFSDEWHSLAISQAVSNVGGTALEEFVNNQGRYKFISIGNYSVGGHYVDNGQRIDLNEKTEQKLLKKHELVMVLNDKTARGDLIGATILIDNDDSYVYNQRSERLIPKEGYDSSYLWFLFNSERFRKRIVSIAQGGTQIYVNFPSVKKMIVAVPDLEEQQKIADFLTLVDKKIESVDKKIELLKQYKKAVMRKIFTRQVQFESGSGGKDRTWQKFSFSEVLTSVPTKQYQVQSEDYLSAGSYPVVDQGQEENVGYSNNAGKVFKDIPVIVFGDHTTILKYIDYEFVVGADGTKLLVAETGNNLQYLYYYLQYNRIEPEGYKRHFSTLRLLDIYLPKIEEQRSIAEFLGEIDKKVKLEETRLANAKKYKKALLRETII